MSEEQVVAQAEMPDYSHLQDLVGVKVVAEHHKVDNRIVRNAAKAGEIPGAVHILGKYGFNLALAMTWKPPEAGTRTAAREDGRRRYTAMLNDEEAAKLVAEGYELVDPRIAAKARRAARAAAKLVAAAEGVEASDDADVDDDVSPFETFGDE